MPRYIALLLSLLLFSVVSHAEDVDLGAFCVLRGNTYIVDKDINLNGLIVRVKDNSTIRFRGGSLSNGKIELSNTYLKGRVKLYSDVTGSVSNKKGHIEWFGQSGDDVTSGLQVLANSCSTIIIDKGTWAVSSGVVIKSDQVIRGVSKKESIIKVDEESLTQSRGRMCVFSTLAFKLPYISTENLRNKPDDFYESRVFKNISISNITFDLNRHPSFFLENRNIGMISLIAIRFENCEKCSIKSCCFKDYQEFDLSGNDEAAKRKKSDAYAAVFITDCSQCEISSCESQNCTFLYVVNSDNVLVERNTGVNSFESWIETLGGERHKILNNRIENQWWKVSTIGVNSVNCEVAHNTVINSTDNEISCITLGHDSRQVLFKYGMSAVADGAFVHDNILETTAERGILVQSASDVRIINNIITCSPRDNSIDRAGIVLVGDVTNFKNETIQKNKIHLKAGKGIGVIGLEMADARIEDNTIDGLVNTGIWIKDKSRNVLISGNRIYDAEYAVRISWADKVTFSNNRIVGGKMDLRCDDLKFIKNQWTGIMSQSSLSGLDEDSRIEIKDNLFEREEGAELIAPFKYKKIDIYSISNNKLKNGFATLGTQ